MMRKNPAERYTVEQVLAHPWLENIEVKKEKDKSVAAAL
jgi:hypothetical protein